jgi:hypothetical protein
LIEKKRRKKDWHHRVPDFKLVYCGTRKRMKEEEPKKFSEKRLEASTKKAG